jgi:lipopolysaccharide transport system ATP-binding protein
MQTVSREGRTVLFVSHNLGAVRSLCDRGIVLQHGRVAVDEPVTQAVAAYLATLEAASSYDVLGRTDRQGKGDARVTRIDVSSDVAGGTLTTGRPARFVFHVSGVLGGMSCAFDVFDPLGQQITYFNSALSGVSGPSDGATFVCDVEELLLVPNRYRIDVALTANGELQDRLEGALFVDVDHGAIRGWPVPDYTNYGSVVLPHRWTKPV